MVNLCDRFALQEAGCWNTRSPPFRVLWNDYRGQKLMRHVIESRAVFGLLKTGIVM